LGFLALAIEQAAAYIREELKKDIFMFRPIYATQRSQFLDRQSTGNSYYKNNIATTWLMSVNVVESRNQQAVRLLQLFALMNPDGISLEFLQDGRNAFPDDLKGENPVAFTANLISGLKDLEQFSLISRPNSDLVLIHRLVQSVIKDRLSPDGLNGLRSLVCDIGLSAFSVFAHDDLLRARKYQAQVIAIVGEIKEMQTVAAAYLLDRVGQFFVDDGKARDGHSLISIAV
jgi:hypothetical protein